MTEREHCEEVAQEFWNASSSWDLAAIVELVARERAAARAEALEEAAKECEQRLLWRQSSFDGLTYAMNAIRALKTKERP